MQTRFSTHYNKSWITSVFFLLTVSCGSKPQSFSELQERWDRRNRPEIFDPTYKLVLQDLPLKGQVVTPWSDSYWPSYVAGLANRWNASWSTDQFNFPLHRKEDIEKMSMKELSKLSPAEKYDIYLGSFSYPLVSYERARTSPDLATWEGMCHGWAPAAINFEEPHPVIVTSPSGLKVPFGSSDIKALLSLLQGNFYEGPTAFLGGRCNQNLKTDTDKATDPECKDVNAGSFHLVLTNEIGLKKKGFVMDVTRDLQVWNQPVFQYEVRTKGEQPPSPGAAEGTVKEVLVDAEVTYGAESVAQWEHLGRNDDHISASVVYEYRLELNDKGEIIGGEWIGFERPDFLWRQDKAEFTGFFKPLETIYQTAISPENMKTLLENPAFQNDATPSQGDAPSVDDSQDPPSAVTSGETPSTPPTDAATPAAPTAVEGTSTPAPSTPPTDAATPAAPPAVETPAAPAVEVTPAPSVDVAA